MFVCWCSHHNTAGCPDFLSFLQLPEQQQQQQQQVSAGMCAQGARAAAPYWLNLQL
jgi:hypothetical protein